MTKHERFIEEIATSDIRVRLGMPEDVHPVMEVALMACEENAICKPNPEKLLQDVWCALNLIDGICGIIGKPGKIVEGVVVLRSGTLWYSDDPIIEEKAIFVRPEYRSAKGGRAARLCEFSKKAADYLGVPLTIGIMSNARTAAKIKMYSRMLGEPSGAYWLYGAKTGEWSNKD